MEDRDWGHIVWIVVKVLFWLIVASAVIALITTMLGAGVKFLGDNPWVGWVLSIAFWVIVIWYNHNKDSKK